MTGRAEHAPAFPVDRAETMPHFSVVVPCYNQAHFLRFCLRSVSRQTFKDWECIVVDDGSSDRMVESVLAEFGDSRFRLVRHAQNRGLAAARNSGLAEARARWVVCVDADDLVLPKFLAKVYERLAEEPWLDAVFTDFLKIGDERGIKRRTVQSLAELLVSHSIPGSGTVFRKRIWEAIGGYREDLEFKAGNEDWEFWIRAAEAGIRMGHIPEPLYVYRRHPESMMRKLAFSDWRVRETMYGLHRATFRRFGLQRRFLGDGYWNTAQAWWRAGQPMKALLFAVLGAVRAPSWASCRRLVHMCKLVAQGEA